ncbi:PHP domain-containing protein [bacterium]|nr:PHP domain-containing protein [bacterium]
MKANLHLHSLYSDGYQWPKNVAKRAAGLGIEIVSLTDHDCMNGVQEFIETCNKNNITGIPGVEIDCCDKENGFWGEILGYFPEGNYKNTLHFTIKLMNNRLGLMKRLLKSGRNFYKNERLNLKEMLINKTGSSEFDTEQFCFSKPDLLYLLRKEKILAENIPYMEYKKLFDKGQVFDVPKSDPPPHLEEVIDVIKSDGGYPVLAHPVYVFEMNSSNMIDLEETYLDMFTHLKKIGLWGIEYNYYGDKTSLYNKQIKKIADKTGFTKFTCGSDDHGLGHEHDTMEKYICDFEKFDS